MSVEGQDISEVEGVKPLISGRVDVSKVRIIDEGGLGPLPPAAVEYLAALGATIIKICCFEHRSWIVTGINVWRGQKRVFLCRVFKSGFVRGYLAPPLDCLDTIVNDLRAMAREVVASE